MFDDFKIGLDPKYDMSVDTTGLPEGLANKINNNICWKGGGGGSTTTVSGVPDEFKPYVTDALAESERAYKQGDLSHVEGLTDEQLGAFDRKLELGQRGGVYDQIASDSYDAGQAYRDAAAGQGLYGADALGNQITALEDSIGKAQAEKLAQLNSQAAVGGTLGSARNQRATQAALADVAGNIASKELANRRAGALSGAQGVIGSGAAIQDQFGAGVKATEGVGAAIQQQQQNEADARAQGLTRRFGFLGSPAVCSTQKSTSSSGGK